MFWSDEESKELRRLWLTGIPTREIAIKLGDYFTKNMVIGRANRMGLPARAVGSLRRKNTSQPQSHRG